MILVGLAGPAGCGKDTAAKYLSDKCDFAWYAFADPLRAALNAMFGWGEEQWEDREWRQTPLKVLGNQTPRRAIQTLGTEWGRDLISPSLWLDVAHYRFTENVLLGYPGMVISDVRFPNEAAWVRERGTLIHIVRDVKENTDIHVSEAGVEFQEGDHTVLNTGSVEQLYLSLNIVLARAGRPVV